MTDLKKIKGIISEKFGVSDNLLTGNAKLADDLNLSPLEIADLIGELSREFAFSLPEDFNIKEIASLSDLFALVEQQASEL